MYVSISVISNRLFQKVRHNIYAINAKKNKNIFPNMFNIAWKVINLSWMEVK